RGKRWYEPRLDGPGNGPLGHDRDRAQLFRHDGSPDPATRRTLGDADPIVPVIFPEAARIIIRDRQRNDKFRVLKTELRRYTDLHRIAEFARQHLVGVKAMMVCGWRAVGMSMLV